MGQTGKAAVFLGPGKPFEIRELPLPPLEPGAPLEEIDQAFQEAEWHDRESAASRITRAALLP